METKINQVSSNLEKIAMWGFGFSVVKMELFVQVEQNFLIVMKFSFFWGYELLLNGSNTFKVEGKESLVIMAQSRTALKKRFQILLNLKKIIIFLPLVPKRSHNIKILKKNFINRSTLFPNVTNFFD
jgi:hypothetical protein